MHTFLVTHPVAFSLLAFTLGYVACAVANDIADWKEETNILRMTDIARSMRKDFEDSIRDQNDDDADNQHATGPTVEHPRSSA